MSISSMEVYRKRINKVISDFQKYGIDPSKMNSWTPNSSPVRKNRLSQKQNESKVVAEIVDQHPTIPEKVENDGNPSSHMSSKGLYTSEIPLGNGLKAVISYPENLSKDQVAIIKQYVLFLEATAK